MPGFDFSKAKLSPWKTSLPGHNLFMSEAGRDQGRFLAHFYLLDGQTADESLFRFFRLKCKPVFAILVKDEAFALSLWVRCADLGLKGVGNHLIVEDSAWVRSFQTHESYGDSWSKDPMVHYVLCCGNDFVHLLSKDPPQIDNLGVATNQKLKDLKTAIELLEERLSDTVH